MRLYKAISPILVMVIVLGIALNTSGLDTSYFGDNIDARYGVNMTGSLKKSIDDKYRLDSSSLVEISIEARKITRIASKQVGNVGGKKFWSWLGFNQRVAWCGCFVSWCADQCGLIEKGIIPKFASVKYGQDWFKSRNQWLAGSQTPQPGMIIFFDFTESELNDVRDGITDHVGIVTSVKDGYVYCVEGNYNDMVASTKYVVGHVNILGYGVPQY